MKAVVELRSDAAGRSTPARLALPARLLPFGFALGAAPVVLLFVLVATGIPLALHYRPGLPESAQSVQWIEAELPVGWYLRAVHHWAAALLAVTTVLHLLRVALARAFGGASALTWLYGVGLLVLVMLAALTGDVLPGDRHGYWALRMAQQAIGGLPFAGEPLARVLLGAGLADSAMLARVTTVHVAVVPAALALAALGHLGRVRRSGIAAPEGAPSAPTEPSAVPYFRVELGMACLLLLVLNLLAVLCPPALGPTADPLVSPVRIEPGWVGASAAGWFDRVASPAAQLVALGLGVLLASWPWLDDAARRRGAAWAVSAWWLVAAVVGVVALGLYRVVGAS